MTFSLEFVQLDSYEQCSKPAKNAIGRRGLQWQSVTVVIIYRGSDT